jgi:hypothetical protein
VQECGDEEGKNNTDLSLERSFEFPVVSEGVVELILVRVRYVVVVVQVVILKMNHTDNL